jgi:hypothetical protein
LLFLIADAVLSLTLKLGVEVSLLTAAARCITTALDHGSSHMPLLLAIDRPDGYVGTNAPGISSPEGI